jgi:hypothetical protein
MRRREFVLCSSAACLAAATWRSRFLEAKTPDLGADKKLSRSNFERLVGGRFRCYQRVWRHIDLVLSRVDDGPLARGVDQFFLVFQGSTQKRLSAGMYLFHDETGSDFHLYLEPAEEERAPTTYKATLSLLA